MAIKRAAVSTTGGLLVLSHLLPPNEGVGGLMPTPMKDSAASVKIVSEMPKAIETTIEVSGARQDVAGHHPPASGEGSAPGGVGDGDGCATPATGLARRTPVSSSARQIGGG